MLLEALLGEVDTAIGRVSICEVAKNGLPYEFLRHERIFAAVITAPVPDFSGERVAMLVTVFDERYADESVSELGQGDWDGQTRMINNVYRHASFRTEFLARRTPAVEVGRFMLEKELFLCHSTIRTIQGTKWAEAVGCDIPQLKEYWPDPESLVHAE